MVERPRQTDKTEEPALGHGNQYRSRRNVKAIRSISRYHTKWVFKWCGNQVEKGFTGHVISPCHYSQAPPRSTDSRIGRVDMARICDWVSALDLGAVSEIELDAEDVD